MSQDNWTYGHNAKVATAGVAGGIAGTWAGATAGAKIGICRCMVWGYWECTRSYYRGIFWRTSWRIYWFRIN